MLHMFSETILLVRIILFLTVNWPRVIITLVLKSCKITIFYCDIFVKNIFINQQVDPTVDSTAANLFADG